MMEHSVFFFSRFSNWIYNGIVEDPGQELFIEFMNYYLPKTKSYFDKAFVVKQSSVPGFLQGWENSILLCGKYSNLLKLYNPMVKCLHLSFKLPPNRCYLFILTIPLKYFIRYSASVVHYNTTTNHHMLVICSNSHCSVGMSEIPSVSTIKVWPLISNRQSVCAAPKKAIGFSTRDC